MEKILQFYVYLQGGTSCYCGDVGFETFGEAVCDPHNPDIIIIIPGMFANSIYMRDCL